MLIFCSLLLCFHVFSATRNFEKSDGFQDAQALKKRIGSSNFWEDSLYDWTVYFNVGHTSMCWFSTKESWLVYVWVTL